MRCHLQGCLTHRTDVEVLQRGALQPFSEVVFAHAGLGLEDGKGDGPGEGMESMSQHPTIYSLSLWRSSRLLLNSGEATGTVLPIALLIAYARFR